jgi:lipoate-protein ligase A
MRAEEKIAGGKLVCVEVRADGRNVGLVRITGDFFLHPEERIEALEQALVGAPLSLDEGRAAKLLGEALGDGMLIGATAADLARLFRRAVS